MPKLQHYKITLFFSKTMKQLFVGGNKMQQKFDNNFSIIEDSKSRVQVLLNENYGSFKDWALYDQQLSSTTYRRYISSIVRWNKTYLDDLSDVNFTRKILIEYIKNNKPSEGNNMKYSLRAWYKFTKQNFIEISSVKTKKCGKKYFDILTDDEFEKILSCEIEQTNYFVNRNNLILMLLWTTGIRVDELINLRFEDIGKNELLIKSGKGNKQRIVFLQPKLSRRLKALKTLHPDDLIFLGKSHCKLCKQTVVQMIKKRVHAANIEKDITTHSFRRSFATRLLTVKGVDIETVRNLMGHEKIETTARYIHIDKDYIMKEVTRSFPKFQ